jgi:hypothetical protein
MLKLNSRNYKYRKYVIRIVCFDIFLVKIKFLNVGNVRITSHCGAFA